MPEPGSSHDQQARAVAEAYSAEGVPNPNAEMSEIVRNREAEIKRERQYLATLPSAADRLEARASGIGPMLPGVAMSLNPPSADDITYARETKSRIESERADREKLAKEAEEKVAKEREEKERQEQATNTAGEFLR